MNDDPTLDLRRRRFLAVCGTAGAAGTLFPGALWAASSGGTTDVTVEMIDHAARLAGLTFPEAERERMVDGLRANLAAFEESAALDLDPSVAPALIFDPVPPGHAVDVPSAPLVVGRTPELQRPERLEDVAFWPVTDLAALIASRQVTAVELTRMYLGRIRRLDPRLNAVVTITEARALAQATERDAELAAGRYRGPLHGIPWGAKDLLSVAGYPTTWGFEPYRDQVIEADATVVRRLDDAGAVLIAKLSTGEIARGDVWLGKQTRNPWKPDEGSGGSSAGPAAAVAAGLAAFALGTDTLGSVVGPSRTCGITGLRPTFGRVPRTGCMPVCWSLDKIGPMTRTAEDAAIVLDAIRGPDGLDRAVPGHGFAWDGTRGLDGLRVGVLAGAVDALEGAEAENARRTLAILRDLGVDPVPVELPAHADMDALQMLLVDEAAAFDELIRTGDVKYFRQDIDEPEDVLMRVARLYPAVEYVQTHRRRTLLMQGMASLFETIDVMVAPFGGSPQQSATSLTGHPSVALQTGFDPAGRPTGIQFVGRLYGEAEALTLARHVQQRTDLHRRHPAAFT
jgi:Asp-tRNA(Asn)/Glu-tRNA(Gln) amidotransferase A subunit family amidase